MTFRTVFAVYDGMTHLDFTGPHMFLSRLPGAETLVASEHGGTVTAGGLNFAGTIALADIAACDLICVPGGLNATEVALRQDFVAEVRRLALGARYITSVCTGSIILGAAGLIEGRRVACHWAWRDYLKVFGAIAVADRVVRDGDIITGGGVTAGIDFALTVVADIAGEDVAKDLQLGLEYDPQPPFDCGSPDVAPAELVEAYLASIRPLAAQRLAQCQEAASRVKGG